METDNELYLNNGLIAEFMGYELGSVGYVGGDSETSFQRKHKRLFAKKRINSVGEYWVNPSNSKVIDLQFEPLQYSTSWDWLMEVVDKVENIRHIGIDAIYLKIQKNTCEVWTYYDIKECLRLTGDDKNEGNKFKVGYTASTKIEATYYALIDFIKWYNTTKKAKADLP